jgi:hypothetical protein
MTQIDHLSSPRLFGLRLIWTNFSERRQREVHAFVKARLGPVQMAHEAPKGKAILQGIMRKVGRSRRGSA